ncbi:MAG TPA: hypothetical protein VFL93_03850 [Longimicrobiaceae bacterium]|nr:hypothetical protein [Longimicrobiaceae bacterium]
MSQNPRAAHGLRAAQAGIPLNVVLAVPKRVGGIVGHRGALFADAAESHPRRLRLPPGTT